MNTIAIREMGRDFFGYGRWEAPYWFIGPEPGMEDAGGDSLQQRAEAWQVLDSRPLVDCRAHHGGFGYYKWHESGAATQPTWRQLIRLLLSYKGQSCEIEAIRDYQIRNWGRVDGETCVIELSGLAAPNLGTSRDRTSFLAARIDRIKSEIRRVQESTSGLAPEFIVMYGIRNRTEWKMLAGGAFDADGFRMIDGTIAVCTIGPTAPGVGNDHWEKLGREIAKKRR